MMHAILGGKDHEMGTTIHGKYGNECKGISRLVRLRMKFIEGYMESKRHRMLETCESIW